MILLDTDLLIEVLRGNPKVVGFVRNLESAGQVLGTTSINAAELYHGAERSTRRTDIKLTDDLLAGLHQVPFGPQGARRYGTLMATMQHLGKSMAKADGMIAALALENGGRLATLNVRDFRAVPRLEVLTPGKSASAS